MFSLIEIGHLVLRKSTYNLPELIALVIGFLILGLARLSNGKNIATSFGTFMNFKTEIVFNDSIKTDRFGSFLLTLNFWISSSLFIFLLSAPLIKIELNHYLFSIGLSTTILIVYLLSIYFVVFISGVTNHVPLGILHNVNFLHIAGILTLIFSLPLLLNPNLITIFIYMSIGIFGLVYLARLVKIFSFALNENIPLYYIILYLCTLEIFPVYLFVGIFRKFVGF